MNKIRVLFSILEKEHARPSPTFPASFNRVILTVKEINDALSNQKQFVHFLVAAKHYQEDMDLNLNHLRVMTVI